MSAKVNVFRFWQKPSNHLTHIILYVYLTVRSNSKKFLWVWKHNTTQPFYYNYGIAGSYLFIYLFIIFF